MKEKLNEVKEKIGEFWDENGTIIITACCCIAFGVLGCKFGIKYEARGIATGLDEVIERYPNRPLNELHQAVEDTLAAVKAK